MSDSNNGTASMPRLILIYVAYVLLGAAMTYGIMQLWWKYSGEGFPLAVMFLILPMLGAMMAGKRFVQDTGRKASFGFSLIFGLVTTLIVLAFVYGAMEMGWLDAVLYQVDAYAMNNGMKMRVYTPMLIISGFMAILSNVFIFWAATIGEVKRNAQLRAKEAAKNG